MSQICFNKFFISTIMNYNILFFRIIIDFLLNFTYINMRSLYLLFYHLKQLQNIWKILIYWYNLKNNRLFCKLIHNRTVHFDVNCFSYVKKYCANAYVWSRKRFEDGVDEIGYLFNCRTVWVKIFLLDRDAVAW